MISGEMMKEIIRNSYLENENILYNELCGKDGFALLRPSNEQYIKEVDVLNVWWDNWCSVEMKSVILCFVVL